MKIYRNLLALTGIASLAAVSGTALAVPVAQLDIVGGEWDGGTETVVTSADDFTLYGYANTENAGGRDLDTDLAWYLAIAITAPEGADLASFGSFTVGGSQVFGTDPLSSAALDFFFGVPPVESSLGHDGHDLAQHGIYETLFALLDVDFTSPDGFRNTVDVNESWGTDPALNPGNALAFIGWDFDVSGLADGYGLHFDLFGVSGDCGITSSTEGAGTPYGNCIIPRGQFAPFSHDAATSVPEPSAVVLLGSSLLLISAFSAVRRRRQT